MMFTQNAILLVYLRILHGQFGFEQYCYISLTILPPFRSNLGVNIIKNAIVWLTRNW
jgi:hypothetical protein